MHVYLSKYSIGWCSPDFDSSTYASSNYWVAGGILRHVDTTTIFAESGSQCLSLYWVYHNTFPWKERQIYTLSLVIVNKNDKKLAEICRPSSSKWASPLIVINKNDKKLHTAGDYRRLYLQTKARRYSLLHLFDSTIYLSGKKYFHMLI